jgi:hypothetical protein
MPPARLISRRLRLSWLPLCRVAVAPLSAQEHAHDPGMKIEGGGVLPAGWSARPDEGGKLTDVKFEGMAPGWHATMGGAAIIYRAADKASAPYTVTSKIHLFPGSGDHAEAFGLFIGGQALDGAAEQYTYFLIRGDGTWKIKQRNGAKADDVTKGWQPSPAIVQGKADGPVVNILSVAVEPAKVHFMVNGTEVWSGTVANSAGIAGLRLNHNLSLHVETLELKR